MGARALAALLVLVTTTVGCEFDLTPVQRQGQAHLSIQLQVSDVGGPLEAYIFFHPGFVGAGLVRSLADDSLRVNGVAIAPTEHTPDGGLLYRISGVDASVRVLRVQPPAMLDLAEAPPEVTVHRIAPVAPDTIVARRDETIEVRVSGLDQTPSQGASGYWAVLAFAHGCGGPVLLSATGHTVPPAVLGLSAALLPSDLVSGTLRIEGHMRWDGSSPGGSYEILVLSRFTGCVPFRLTG